MHTFEAAQKLSDRINLYKANRPRPVNAAEYDLSSEIRWGASYFYAGVLLKSITPEGMLTDRQKLEALAADYYVQTGQAVNIEALMQKGWLRVVFGKAVIPAMVRSALFFFDRVEPLAAEAVFFGQLSSEAIKKINTEEELIAAASVYARAKGVTLNVGACKNVFWSPDKEKVNMLNMSYSNFVLGHLAEFRFLRRLQELQRDNALKISKTELADIHGRHAAFFKATPPLSEFIIKGTFVPDEGGTSYTIHLRESGWAHEPVRDKYCALLWEALSASPDFESDEERIRNWYYRCVYHTGHADVLSSFPAEQRKGFLDTALRVILTESDLGPPEDEYLKLMLDNGQGHSYELLMQGPRAGQKPVIADGQDLFDLYENLEEISHGHGPDLLIRQDGRQAIAYFIGQVVRNDDARAFERVKALFAGSRDRPYVFWYTCLMLHHWRPEIIPFLALYEPTAALAFSLGLEADVSTYAGEDKGKEEEALQAAIFGLVAQYTAQTAAMDEARKARIIFQCLVKATSEKFKKNKAVQEQRAALSTAVRDILRECELPCVTYRGNVRSRDLLFPQLLDGLYDEIIHYNPADVYENGLFSLPVVKLDLLEYLTSLCMEKDAAGQAAGTAQLAAFCKGFLDTYLAALNCKEVLKRDYFGDHELKPAVPSWVSHDDHTLKIKWGAMCLRLRREFLFDRFLSPAELAFSDSPDKHDAYNTFTAQKLRSHLLVLITAFNDIYQEQRELRNLGSPVDRTLNEIELKITEYVIRYSVTEPAQRRYDIFNVSLERWFRGTDNNELLPMIGTLLNRFQKDNRQDIIRGLVQSEQLLRSFKLLESIVSEDERRRLLRIITAEKDIARLFEELSFPDMQFVLLSLSQDEEFIQPAADALTYVELFLENVRWMFEKHENQVFLFRMKLLQAFQKGDQAAIDQVPGIDVTHYAGQPFSPQDEKNFYRALLYLKNKQSREAYELFHALASGASEERPVLALNRFAAKLSWSDETPVIKEKMKLCQEALDEWMSFENSYPKDRPWPAIRENISYNKLHAYFTLEDDDQFDKIYAGLEPSTKMRPHFLTIRIKALARRKMHIAAEELLAAARQYHILENGAYPDFIYELEKISHTEESLDYLAGQYDRIFRLSPEKLIQVIPDRINSGRTLAAFILNELLASANDMLTLINSISKVDHEDKYSDLLMLALGGRLLNYHWRVNNLRSGFSDPNDDAPTPVQQQEADSNPGEIDFGISTANGERIALCEAMILGGRDAIDTQKHNLKIFNYEPARKLFFVITYFKGGPEAFESTWKSYLDVVDHFIEFPALYAMKGKAEPLRADELDSTIRVAKSLHGTGTELYHLFINVNYKLELKKKTVRGHKAKSKGGVPDHQGLQHGQ